MIYYLVSSIGDITMCDLWLEENNFLFKNKNHKLLINNSNFDKPVLDFWNKLESKNNFLKVSHTKKEGIVKAFNKSISQIDDFNGNYFVHLGIDDIVIGYPKITDKNIDLYFIPVYSQDSSGKTTKVSVRKPMAYYKRYRYYTPHHQGTLYSTNLLNDKLSHKNFYNDNVGICFDSHKTLDLVIKKKSFIVLKDHEPIIIMKEGGISSNVKNLIKSNKMLTKDLNIMPNIFERLINYVLHILIDKKKIK